MGDIQNWNAMLIVPGAQIIQNLRFHDGIECGERFLAELQPFIWRRNLDFAAIADIHSIKR